MYSGVVRNIQLTESMIALERGASPKYREVYRGTERVPYHSSSLVKYELRDGSLMNINMETGTYSTGIPHAKLNQVCRDVCVGYDMFKANFANETACVAGLKEALIRGAYSYHDDFLQDNYS